MTERAAAEGLEFHFDLARGGNTFDAHRLIHLAATYGHQAAAQERLMRAYFTEGEAISDPETLVRLVAELGVDADEARDVLAADRFAEDVREDEQLAGQLGIQGVPFFVLDRRYGVSGAQPPEVLARAPSSGPGTRRLVLRREDRLRRGRARARSPHRRRARRHLEAGHRRRRVEHRPGRHRPHRRRRAARRLEEGRRPRSTPRSGANGKVGATTPIQSGWATHVATPR